MWALLPLLLVIQLTSVSSFAEWMVNDYCGRTLVVGQVIMNEDVVESTSRMIEVYRGEDRITSGVAFIPGEEVTVRITNGNNEFVYETNGGAKFENGGCNGRRVANLPFVKLTLPTEPSPTGSVKIVAGWAEGRGQVKITLPFFLVNPEGANEAPSTIVMGATKGPAQAPNHAHASAQDELRASQDLPSEEEKLRLRGQVPAGAVRTETTDKARIDAAAHLSVLYKVVTDKVVEMAKSSWLSSNAPAASAGDHTLNKIKRKEQRFHVDRMGRRVATDDDENLSEFAKLKKGPHHAEMKKRRQLLKKTSMKRQIGYIILVVGLLVAVFFLVDCCMKNRFKAYKYIRTVRGDHNMDE